MRISVTATMKMTTLISEVHEEKEVSANRGSSILSHLGCSYLGFEDSICCLPSPEFVRSLMIRLIRASRPAPDCRSES